jgi:hypothetical protein
MQYQHVLIVALYNLPIDPVTASKTQQTTCNYAISHRKTLYIVCYIVSFNSTKDIFYNAHLRIKQLSKFPHQATTVHIPLSMHYIRNVRGLSVEQINHNSVNTANI